MVRTCDNKVWKTSQIVRIDVLDSRKTVSPDIKVPWKTVIHTAWMLLQMFQWEHLLRFHKYD